MPLTEAQRKSLLVLEVGDTPAALLAANVGLLWERTAALEPVSATLRDLTVKRGLIDLALGAARQSVTFTDGDHAQSASHVAQRLIEMRAAVVAEIALAEARGAGRGGVALGQLTTVTPEVPPVVVPARHDGPDALDPPYLGSPDWRGRRSARW